ncbi:MAG TPA: alanyl-tRNA editing protein [bacterium]|nr:alanyl-tRNA editing protein [bacterium]
MTEKLYQQDGYLQTFEAKVIAVDNEQQAIVLDRTAFYPGGGGQPNDVGRIEFNSSGAGVVRVKMQDRKIFHYLDNHPPQIGTMVKCQLDWERRYALMRTHSALHVLCGVVWRDHGAQVTGGNMEPLKGRMDFEFENLQKELVQQIEDRVNQEVSRNHEIRTRLLPREQAFQIPDLIRTKINLLPPQITEVRTVEIVGLDLQADGGTHVANTSEIGQVSIVDYKSKGKINKRIHIELDKT